MSTITTYALIATLALGIIVAVVYAFRRDAEAERIRTTKVLMLKQVLPASRPHDEAATEADATPPKIETSLFSDTDDAYRRNHVSVIGEHDRFHGKNNVAPP